MASNAVDAKAKIGMGGGNVTEDQPGIISLAGKFGLRAKEVPVLNKITEFWSARQWKKSVSVTANGCRNLLSKTI